MKKGATLETGQRSPALVAGKAASSPEGFNVRRTIDMIYETERGRAGCCLHIVTDDRNYTDNAVAVVMDAALASRHPMCELVARFLDRLTVEERRSFLRVRRKAAR